jgi:glycosyltransferase involved in cell wall biosynthesis
VCKVQPDISIVVPVYNSALIIPELLARVQTAMQSSTLTYELLLADDCSTDNSWQVIAELCKTNGYVTGLRLSKNYGQWCSTLAGISRASGKYIITVDDDLEYEPADILKLYHNIISGEHYVVFGMAKDKYLLQGKNERISKWRKSLVHRLWSSPPTDSFKIFTRNLVFNGHQFLPTVFLDAFIIHQLDKKFIGYMEVGFNKRFAGVSNTPFLKKIQFFFLYGFHFALHPEKYVVVLTILFLCCIAATVFLSVTHTALPFLLPVVGLLLLVTGLLNLYYSLGIFSKTKQLPLYLIIEEANQKLV